MCNPLDFLFLLWPESLCDLIVNETNRYGRSKPNWLDIDRDELLTFFWLITMMRIKVTGVQALIYFVSYLL